MGVGVMRGVLSAAIVVAGCVALAGQSPTPTPASAPVRTIPVGAQFNVVLQTLLDSAKAKVGDHFSAGTIEDWQADGQVVVEAGAAIRGFVSSVRPSTRPVQDREAQGMGQLTLSFDDITLGEKPVKLRAAVAAVLDARRQPDDKRRTTTANVVGGVDSFGLPAWPDVVVTGGSILPVGAGDVKLPVGVVLRIRINQAMEFAR
jgi:hypothetical protein